MSQSLKRRQHASDSTQLTDTGTGNDVIVVARCPTDDVEIDGTLTGGESHEALAGVGATVTSTDDLARLGWALARTHTAAVLAARTVTARDRRTRVYANHHQSS